MSTSPKSVLFVCMGNICRSPTGEAVMRRVVEDRGLEDRFEIDSAGTIKYHVGEPPDARMTDHAARRGIKLGGRSRQIKPGDLDRFDLIVAMDRDNLSDIRLLDGDGNHDDKIKLLSDFLPKGFPRDVPDPYYGGEQGFETVLDMIEEACGRIVDALLEQD